MTAHTDDELIQLFKSGHDSAFNELVVRYQEKIYWVARRFVNDHDQADDVTQEVFVKAYESLGSFRSDSSIYTWLYRIAVNVSLNFIRRQKVRDFLHLDELLHSHESENPGPDEILEKQEEHSLIEEAIERLPKKQKAVFLMRYYDELPYEEIAKILHTSVGGLKANYFHAVKKIQEYLRRAHGSH